MVVDGQVALYAPREQAITALARLQQGKPALHPAG
jgi:hypothetical protein